ncbi:hypothetical protein SLS58_000182 [Diplodia intermedia]|uniref:Uncharacterized protein n=1 Tax=Diplodia intermedia TaxID=856260 RepID=A0ABR3U6N1_9PEZI
MEEDEEEEDDQKIMDPRLHNAVDDEIVPYWKPKMNKVHKLFQRWSLGDPAGKPLQKKKAGMQHIKA